MSFNWLVLHQLELTNTIQDRAAVKTISVKNASILQLLGIHYFFAMLSQENRRSPRQSASILNALIPRDLNRKLSGLEQFFNVSEKLFRIRSIDDPVIKAQGKIRHLPNRDVVFAVR